MDKKTSKKAIKEKIAGMILDTIEESEITYAYVKDIIISLLSVTANYNYAVNLAKNEMFLDKESTQIIIESVEELLKDNVFMGMIKEVSKEEEVKKVFDLIKDFVLSMKEITPARKVTFITIPDKDLLESVLDFDWEGKECMTCVGMSTQVPNKQSFGKDSPAEGKDAALYFLNALDNIERKQKYSVNPPPLGKAEKYNDKFVCWSYRDTGKQIRIQFNYYHTGQTNGDRIVVVSGIFRKDAQNDNFLQKQYATRKKIIDEMEKREIKVETCEKVFREFKMGLIKKVYEDSLETRKSVRNTLANYMWALFKKERNIYDERMGF